MTSNQKDIPDTTLPIEVAKQAFADILEIFPHLQAIDDTHNHAELSITLPVQDGLKYAVNLNLQNRDELHFSVSHFWLEWFPCTTPDRVDEYIKAVTGFLSGDFRIIEYHRGEKCVKAELQSPVAAGWKTIGTSGSLWSILPRKKRLIVIRNN